MRESKVCRKYNFNIGKDVVKGCHKMTGRLLMKEQMVNKSYVDLASLQLSGFMDKKTLGKEAIQQLIEYFYKMAIISFLKSNFHSINSRIKSLNKSKRKLFDKVEMEIIKSNVDELKKLKPLKFFEQVFSLVIIVGSALALWKTLVLGFNTECPVVVVLTGSMEPGYYRGDILFVTHWDEPLIPGDTVVYNLRTQEIPIVHRVSAVQQRQDGNLYILTKGDNNRVDDRGLYPPGVKWLHKEEIMGKMRAYLPYMGMFTIWLNDYPMFKYAVLGLMGFFVLIAKDPQ